MRRDLYRLTKPERAIFEQAPENPNLFTNWYFRGANTGTWAYPDADDKRYILLHKALMKRWLKLDKPQKFDWAYNTDDVPLVPYKSASGQVFERGLAVPTVASDVLVKFKPLGKMPYFQINHGLWLQDWQIEIMKLMHTGRVLIGGFGSSKTSIAELDMEIKAATLPGFQGFALAPSAMQSTAIYKKMMGRMQGTLYGERFLMRNTRKQPESVVVGNDYTGECSIDFYSIQDNPDKMLNLEGDMAIIDQTEQLQDIPTVRGNIVSRLRGNHQGRDRIGLVYYIANPNDNPELWSLADDAEEHPKEIYYRQIATYDNWALTEKQLRDYEGNIAPGDKNTQNSKLLGFRPKGGGKQFPEASIEACCPSKNNILDDIMDKAIEEGKAGYIKVEYPRVGICQWELPPMEGHTYVVIADPGQDNPPKRNAAAIGVWDITGFPGTVQNPVPAQLVAFNWVFGNNSPVPWMQTFFDYVERYKAIGRCGYDSTGWQSGYQGWVETFSRIQSTGMNMNESNKFMHLNSAKQLMSRGKLLFPTIQGMTSQLAKYNIPDKDITQDIVVMIMLTCTWLQQYFFLNVEEKPQVPVAPPDRHAWRSNSRTITHRR